MDTGTKSQLRRLYNAVRRAVRAPEGERQHECMTVRARVVYTIARHSLRSLDQIEKATTASYPQRMKPVATNGLRTCSKPLSPTTSKYMSAHTAQTELKLIGKLILEGVMHCESGLHVGAGKGSLEIGGSDNPVVKDLFRLPLCTRQFPPRPHPFPAGTGDRYAVSSCELVYLSKRKGQEVRIHQSDHPDDGNLPTLSPQSGTHGKIQRRVHRTEQRLARSSLGIRCTARY